MLEFIVTADLEKNLINSFNFSSTKDFQFIGSEQDGHLIYKCYEENNNGSNILHIGIYECSSNENKILFTTTKNYNVQQATVNQDRSMLAFVSYDIDETSAATISGYPSYVYEVFLISLLQDNDIASLNLHSSTFLQVQFRYRKNVKSVYDSLIKSNNIIPEHQLIVFRLKEDITLYNIDLCNKSSSNDKNWPDQDKNKTSLRFSKEEVLVRSFIWSQWTSTDQCLFYIHFRSPAKPSDLENDKHKEPMLPMLTCLQFHDDIHYETVLTLPIELPSLDSDEISVQCGFNPLLHIISEKNINAEILTQPSGVVCICLYHFTRSDFVDVFDEENSSEDTLTLSYSLICLHHGCTLTCEVPQVPAEFEISSLTFMFYSDNHLLVLLPCVCIHLLDIGLLHEPNNHILLQADCYKGEAYKEIRKCSRNHVLLSSEKMKIFMINLPVQAMLNQLDKSNFTSTRLAIIHYLLIHTKFDTTLLKTLLQTLLEAEERLDVTQLLQEILIATTYAACKDYVKESFLKMFPLSLVEPKTEQIEQGPRHRVRLSYTSTRHSATMLLSPSQRLRPVINDTWINLWNILKLKQCCNVKRLSSNTFHDRFMLALDYSYQVENSEISIKASSPLYSKDLSTLIQITSSEFIVKNIKEHNVDSNMTEINPFIDPLPFPEKDEPRWIQFEHVLSLNLQEMTVHILKYHADKDPIVIHKTASEFVSAQLYASRLLCQLLLSNFIFDQNRGKSISNNTNSGSWYNTIGHLPQTSTKEIFALMEKFQIACTDIAYPVPQGFLPFISILGFHSLPFSMYIQYVDRGALQLRSEVVDYIIREISDNEAEVEKKLELLLRLPRQKAWKYFELWDHPVSLALQSKDRAHLMQTLPTYDSNKKKNFNESNWDNKDFTLSPVVFKEQRTSPTSSTIVSSHACINGSSESTTHSGSL